MGHIWTQLEAWGREGGDASMCVQPRMPWQSTRVVAVEAVGDEWTLSQRNDAEVCARVTGQLEAAARQLHG